MTSTLTLALNSGARLQRFHLLVSESVFQTLVVDFSSPWALFSDLWPKGRTRKMIWPEGTG